MPAPLSMDIRNRVVELRKLSGSTYEYIAESLDIGRASVSRILRLHREAGSVAPKPPNPGPERTLSELDVDAIVAMVEEKPDTTLDELAAAWATRHPSRAVSRQTLGRALQQRGITRKKSR